MKKITIGLILIFTFMSHNIYAQETQRDFLDDLLELVDDIDEETSAEEECKSSGGTWNSYENTCYESSPQPMLPPTSAIAIDELTPTTAITGEKSKITIHGGLFHSETKLWLSLDSGNTQKSVSLYKSIEEANDIILAKKSNLLFLADGTNGLQIIDRSDPTNLLQVSSLATTKKAYSLALNTTETFCFVGIESGLDIINLSNINYPVNIAHINTHTYYELKLSEDGKYIYALSHNHIDVINIENPSSPYTLTSIEYTGADEKPSMAIKGDLLFVTANSFLTDFFGSGFFDEDQFFVFDISRPEAISLLSSMKHESAITSIVTNKNSNYVYFVDNLFGFHVLDISNASAPKIVKTLNVPGEYKNLQLSTDGKKAYITSNNNGMKIINLDNPLQPFAEGSIKTEDNVNSFILEENEQFAFLAEPNHAIEVLEISKSNKSTVFGQLETQKITSAIQLSKDEKQAFIISHTPFEYLMQSIFTMFDEDIDNDLANLTTFRIVNVDSPEVPSEMGVLEIPDYIDSVTISKDEKFAYLSSIFSNIFIVDISNRYYPKIIKEINSNSYKIVETATENLVISANSNGYSTIYNPRSDTPTIHDFKVNENNDTVFDIVLNKNKNLAYMGVEKGIYIVDFTSTLFPEKLSSLATGSLATDDIIRHLVVSDDGSTLYAAEYNKLYIIDIKNPLFPLVRDSIVFESIVDIVLNSNELYVVSEKNGIEIYDISYPLTLKRKGSFSTPGSTQSIDISDDDKYAYIADGASGLVVQEIFYPEYTILDSSTIEMTFPDYTTLGKYNLSVINDNINFTQLNGALTLESKEFIEELETQILELKPLGDSTQEIYDIDSQVTLGAFLKKSNDEVENLLITLNSAQYTLTLSDSSIATLIADRLIFKKAGQVVVNFSALGYSASRTFNVTADYKTANVLDVVIAVGDGVQECSSDLSYSFKNVGNRLYNAFARENAPEHIYYINPNGNEDEFKLIDLDNNPNNGKESVLATTNPTWEGIKLHVRNLGKSDKPILFYFLGHGLPNTLKLAEGEYITASDFKNFLDEITDRGVIVVLDACYSGSFIDELSGENRTIISSANAIQTAKMKDVKYEGFSAYLLQELVRGQELKNAYKLAQFDYKDNFEYTLEPQYAGNTFDYYQLFSSYKEADFTLGQISSKYDEDKQEVVVEIDIDEDTPQSVIDDYKVDIVATAPQNIIEDTESKTFTTPTVQTEQYSMLADIGDSTENKIIFTYPINFQEDGLHEIQTVINPGYGNEKVSEPITIQVGDSTESVNYIKGTIDTDTCKIDTDDGFIDASIDTDHELAQQSFDIGWYFWQEPESKHMYLAQGRDDNIKIWQFMTDTKVWVPVHNSSFGGNKAAKIFSSVFISQDGKHIGIGNDNTGKNHELQNQFYEIGWYFWQEPKSKHMYLAQGRGDDIHVWQFLTDTKLWVPVHNASFGGKSVGSIFNGVSISDDAMVISFW